MRRPPQRRWSDDLVPVMLPLEGGRRGPARRVRGWAMPGEFRYNFGGQGSPPEWRRPCAVMGFEEDRVWISCLSQIAPITCGVDHLFPQDEPARVTLAAIRAAQRLSCPRNVVSLSGIGAAGVPNGAIIRIDGKMLAVVRNLGNGRYEVEDDV